jgi:RimJ/RimL family protein N-acetyltransferase
MSDKYEKYYWQNDKVRLRAMQPEDCNYTEKLDSEAWAMASQEMALPPVKKVTKETDPDITMDINKPVFSIENLNGDYIGDIRFNAINERHGTFELGISIWKNYKNKGYAKAAVKTLLDYAFNERRLNKCNVNCIGCNIASISLLKSLGFKQEGIIREEFFFNGKFHDKILFGLTANEYNFQRTT